MQENNNLQNSMKKKREHLIPLLFLSFCAFIAEGYLFILMFNFELTIVTFLLFHSIVTALAFSMSFLYYLFKWDTRIALFSTFSIGFLGILGALLNMVMIPLYAVFNLWRPDDDGFYEDLLPEKGFSLSQVIYERVEYGMDNFDMSTLPIAFMDILNYGTEKQKRIAIDRMLRHFRPEFSSALQKALNDASNSIRVLAATAVMRIDDQYLKRYYQLEEQVSRAGFDKKLLLELATHCEQFSSLTFVDEDVKMKMNHRALEAYKEYHQASPQEMAPKISMCRLYYHLGKHHEAVESLQSAIDDDALLPDRAYLWYFSALFALKDYQKIRDVAQKDSLLVANDSVEHDDIIDMILLWKRGIGTDDSYCGGVYGS